MVIHGRKIIIYILLAIIHIHTTNSYKLSSHHSLSSSSKTKQSNTRINNNINNNNQNINSITDMNIKMLSGKMSELLFTNKGQISEERIKLFGMNANRPFTDQFLWTHIYLMISSITSYYFHLYELFWITLITTTFSLFYHYKYEKSGIISKLEGFCAKIMYIYGVCQIFQAPSLTIQIIEIGFMSMIAIVFLITNLDHVLYDKYHCFGLHLLPAIWAILVSWKHPPFLF